MKKFAKWLVMVFVVSCICALVLCTTGCGKKDKTIKSVVVNNNGELVAEYDDGTNDVLGTLGNVKSAEEKDGKLVITLKDGSTITCNTAASVGKTIKSISANAGVLHIEYMDGTTDDIDVSGNAGCKHENVKYIEVVNHTAVKNEDGTYTFTDGVYIVACLDCGYTKSEVGVRHSLEKTVVAPTCTEEGYTTVKCTTDGCAYEEAHTNPVPADGHKYDKHEVILESGKTICEDGAMTVDVCSVCGDTVSHWTEPTGHTLDLDYDHMKKPSATVAGSIAGTCSVCDNEITLELPVLTDEKYTKTDISERVNCTDLGKDKYSIVVNYKDHDYSVEFEVAGVAGKHTLNKVEYSSGDEVIITDENKNLFKPLNGAKVVCDHTVEAVFTCDKCTNLITVNVKKDHVEKANTRKVITAATCTEKGKETFECDAENGGCGKTIEVETDLVAHTYKIVGTPEKAEDGTLTIVFKCEVCDYSITKTGVEIIDDQKPTCQKEGVYTWKIDGKEDKFTYSPKTAHSIVEGTTVAQDAEVFFEDYEGTDAKIKILNGKTPTCKDGGVPAVYECVECRDLITIKAVAHHLMPEDVNGNIVKHDATCTEDGYWTYTCAREDCGQNVKDHITAALGHDFNNYEVKFDTEESTKVVAIESKCSRCDETKKITCVGAEYKELAPATCLAEGLGVWHCVITEATETEAAVTMDVDVTLPKTAHSRLVDGELVKVEEGAHLVKTDKDTDLRVLNGTPACDREAQGVFECAVDGCDVLTTVWVKADHKPDTNKPNNTKYPTCTEDGKYDFTCSSCGGHIDDTIPAKGHKTSVSKLVLSGDKFMAVVVCTNEGCTDTLSDVDTRLAVGSEGITKVEEAATCQKAGKITYTVVYDGKTYTVEKKIDRLTTHNKGKEIEWSREIKDADGKLIKTINYKGYICIDCGDVVVESSNEVLAPVETPAEGTDPTTND